MTERISDIFKDTDKHVNMNGEAFVARMGQVGTGPCFPPPMLTQTALQQTQPEMGEVWCTSGTMMERHTSP